MSEDSAGLWLLEGESAIQVKIHVENTGCGRGLENRDFMQGEIEGLVILCLVFQGFVFQGEGCPTRGFFRWLARDKE